MKRVVLRASLLLCLVGCGSDNEVPFEDTVPAGGIATYQGKPLENYRVYFSNSENRTATGLVDKEGRFLLGTNNPGDGAPVGTHRVWLAYEPDVPIEAGKEDQAVIPPPTVKLPQKFTNPSQSGITVDVPAEGDTEIRIDLE